MKVRVAQKENKGNTMCIILTVKRVLFLQILIQYVLWTVESMKLTSCGYVFFMDFSLGFSAPYYRVSSNCWSLSGDANNNLGMFW